ncbi:unnamed protein product [Parnassius apollo]|uniref:(apollo) hypothetical protein n=1 Tax=Parnassius apollo TaxID=110799 RepID=A0A8S3XPD7_PARAO|nr:unnamed protein product [Parnassius apollo]
MSDKRCCVPGCKDSKGKLVLHRFPNPEKESERFRVWIYAIGGDILGLENMHIFKYRRVCHSHFEEKFQCRNNRISNIAVPTLNMPATLSNKPAVMKRKPMKEILNLAEPSTSTDHYSECSVHQLHTKMEGNTSHKENLDPVTPMQDPVISTNPVVIKKRAETFLGGALADKKKTKGILREELKVTG